ncbi:hypothetical protein EAI_15775 [Harpegnathos saltator]|uniref:Uncharacterized protein n=1 Tax=Harpegnathos saltator TaxID=610380 RepID=E2C8D2_HARSA|nr:hypothetical protein EAI_15775 [Harpegnathos saltator]
MLKEESIMDIPGPWEDPGVMWDSHPLNLLRDLSVSWA